MGRGGGEATDAVESFIYTNPELQQPTARVHYVIIHYVATVGDVHGGGFLAATANLMWTSQQAGSSPDCIAGDRTNTIPSHED